MYETGDHSNNQLLCCRNMLGLSYEKHRTLSYFLYYLSSKLYHYTKPLSLCVCFLAYLDVFQPSHGIATHLQIVYLK